MVDRDLVTAYTIAITSRIWLKNGIRGAAVTEQSIRIRSAIEDFHRARRKAALQELLARIRGEPVTLLSYEEVRRMLQATTGRERGLQDISLDAIVGSVGRYTDFTRTFLPKDEVNAQRWARVKAATMDMAGLPPIQVYQIGGIYFVRDGNHRVSVAREIGATYIQAYVTEILTEVPLTSDTDPDDLILKAEYAAFLRWSDLRHVLPGKDLILTVPGKYEDLKEHIRVHQYYMGLEREAPVDLAEAVVHWYKTVYTPIADTINRLGVLRDFLDRTEADLYLWIAEHHAVMVDALGWEIETPDVVADLIAAFSAKPDRILARLGERLVSAITPERLKLTTRLPGQWREQRIAHYGRDPEHLFRNIMVALDGHESGWMALNQALNIAQREKGHILGLHIVEEPAPLSTDAREQLQERFAAACERAKIAGELAISAGLVAHEIATRSRWADLLIAPLNYPPGTRPLEKLRSGFRTMLVNAPCPVLALPGEFFPATQAVLAFDNSPKSREALYVATYLVHCCPGLNLTVVSCNTDVRMLLDTLSEAQAYLGSHSITAETVAVERSEAGSAIREVADTHDADLIIMGGYSRPPLVEIVLGSTVNEVLRTARRPTLICQ
jgi:nucleotide-binding universal stress UspA family protein